MKEEVCLMVGLAYYSTRKVKKCSPMDAIRCGQTGERYGKNSRLKLSASGLLGSRLMRVQTSARSRMGAEML